MKNNLFPTLIIDKENKENNDLLIKSLYLVVILLDKDIACHHLLINHASHNRSSQTRP